MYILDITTIFLLVIHVLETSVLVTLHVKVLLGYKWLTRVFFIIASIFTLIFISWIYVFFFLNSVNKLIILQFWLDCMFPVGLLLLIFYSLNYVIIERDGYTDYLANKILFISLIILGLIYLQVSLFIYTRDPTFIVNLKIFFPSL